MLLKLAEVSRRKNMTPILAFCKFLLQHHQLSHDSFFLGVTMNFLLPSSSISRRLLSILFLPFLSMFAAASAPELIFCRNKSGTLFHNLKFSLGINTAQRSEKLLFCYENLQGFKSIFHVIDMGRTESTRAFLVEGKVEKCIGMQARRKTFANDLTHFFSL